MPFRVRRQHLPGLGGGSLCTSLHAALRSATEAPILEVPKDAVLTIVQFSFTADERSEIMRFLYACLVDQSAPRWRRTCLALAVLQELLDRGAPELLAETASGFHFDLVQRMALLEKYEYDGDLRVQSLIRQRAAAVKRRYRELQLAHSLEGSAGCWQQAAAHVAFSRHCDVDSTDDDSEGDCATSRRRHFPASARLNADGSPCTSTSTATGRGSPCASEKASEDEEEPIDLLTGSPPRSLPAPPVREPTSRLAAPSRGAPALRPSADTKPVDGISKLAKGHVCQALSEITVRRGETFDTEKICDLHGGTVLELLAIGSGRRVKARDLHTGIQGWISVRTEGGITLIEVVAK